MSLPLVAHLQNTHATACRIKNLRCSIQRYTNPPEEIAAGHIEEF